MNRQELVRQLDVEINRLTEARNVLAAGDIAGIRGVGRRRGRRAMSEDAKARISAAQKRRWAARKGGQNSSGSGHRTAASGAVSARRGPRRMSAAARARIAAAQRKRWAAVKAKTQKRK